MQTALEQKSLLKDLEARQDDVLRKLDELNQRLEATLAKWLQGRQSPK